MRFKLYEAEIERSSGWSKAHVVAPIEQRTAELVFDHDNSLGQNHIGFTLECVNETLTDDRRKGLDNTLNKSSVGIAIYNDAIGWVGHVASMQKLQLFGIEDSKNQRPL